MVATARTYRVRNRVVELDELPEVVAVRGSVGGQAVQGIEGQDTFERAGWRFVKETTSGHELVLETGQSSVAKILRKRATGQLVLTLNRATVKFRGGVGAEQIDSALSAVGGRIVQRLPIAENLLTVALDPERDVFAAIATLAKLPVVEFAEPELLEATGHR